MTGAETRANRPTRFSAVRTTTAARSGSVLIAVQGAASCRYSLPSTQSARSAWADLRTSIASNWAVSSASCAPTSANSFCLERARLAAGRNDAVEPRLAELR